MKSLQTAENRLNTKHVQAVSIVIDLFKARRTECAAVVPEPLPAVHLRAAAIAQGGVLFAARPAQRIRSNGHPLATRPQPPAVGADKG